VLDCRAHLKDSVLGEFGAEAIQRELTALGESPPSLSTIGRILVRSGALDAKKRTRRPAPPQGWYLPEVSAGRAELDQFDAIVGLAIRGGSDVEVLNGVSLHGGLIASWPQVSVTTESTMPLLIEHWREFGLPAYAQFDNDNRFRGPQQYTDAVGHVVRLCLSLGVIPVFAPPREPGLQNAIESFNARWQAKVWNRWEHASLA
jgi:putative transposase